MHILYKFLTELQFFNVYLYTSITNADFFRISRRITDALRRHFPCRPEKPPHLRDGWGVLHQYPNPLRKPQEQSRCSARLPAPEETG